MPLLSQRLKPVSRDALYFHYPHYYPTTTPVSAIRKGKWKLIEYFEGPRLELYDLASDPSESTDLASKMPDVVRDLHARLNAWRNETGARLPSPNPDFKL